MMRFLVVFSVLLISLSSPAQSLEEVRTSFHQAVLEPKESRKFHDFVSEMETKSPTVKAYQAASEAMLAQVIWNPFSKLSHVIKFADMIEMAVTEDPENIEIRFLRLAIEYNLPRFLGMSDHLNEDRDVIVDNITSIKTMGIDPDFTRYIIYFLRDTKLCSEKDIVEMESGLLDG